MWVDIPGTTQDWDLIDPEFLADVGLEEGLLVSGNSSMVTTDHGVSGEPAHIIEATKLTTMAVVDELIAQSPAPERYPKVTPVAQGWIFLRLMADPGSAPDVIEELTGDTSILSDLAREHDHYYGENDDFSPPTLIIAGVMLLGTVLLAARRIRNDRRSARKKSLDLEPDPMLRRLTPLALEEALTVLTEKIAASDRVPGDPHYDRAQACVDAANKYADSDTDRDRIGVHFLVEDGERALTGGSRTRRCYFHPAHRGNSTVTRKQVTVPCCAECAAAVKRGDRPPALLLADTEGRVRPYHFDDDVWTSTGYGAIDEHWARRALLAALEMR